MDRWLGDGGMPIIAAIGGSFDGYGPADDETGGGAGVPSVMRDPPMNFSVNAGLTGKDRPRATLDLKSELMLPAVAGTTYRVKGQVVRMAKQVAFVEAAVHDGDGRLISRATATFLLYREAAT